MGRAVGARRRGATCGALGRRAHIDQLLERLIAVTGRSPGGAAVPSVSPPKPGSETRLSVTVRGYHLLRECIYNLIDEAQLTVSIDELRLIDAAISNAVEDAIRTYEHEAIGVESARSNTQRDVHSTHAGEVRAGDPLRLVTDALPVLVSYVTADDRYGFANKAYEDWFGRPGETLIGQKLSDVIGDAAYSSIEPFIQRGLAGERFSFEQYAVPYRDRGFRDVKITIIPHIDEGGEVAGYVALLEDITAHRQLEEEGGHPSRHRPEVLESMGDAFFALDRDWAVVLMNRNYERITGRGREGTLGRNFWDIFPAAANQVSPHYEAYHRCMEKRVEVQFVDYRKAQDVWTDVRVYPTGNGGIAVFLRDVSTAKRAERALKRQAEFEQHLIGIVSHDLRNPLNVILMGAEMLTTSEPLNKSAVGIVGRMQNAANRAVSMVRDLLDFTQARLGGGIPIVRQPSDLNAVIQSVIEEIVATFPERRVDLRLEGDGQGDWDADRMGQVVQNLVTNALKYSPEGSLVRVSTHSESGVFFLTVHNEGAPIAPDDLPIMFEPFQRVTNQADRTSRSIGLGLYIVKNVVEAHRGTVDVQSRALEGTTFTVTLPSVLAVEAHST